MLFTGKCPVSLPEVVLGEAAGTGPTATPHCRSQELGKPGTRNLYHSFWILEELCLLQGPGQWEKSELQGADKRSTSYQEEKPLPLQVSLTNFLLTKLNVILVGKGILFAGPAPIILEKTMMGEFGAERQ